MLVFPGGHCSAGTPLGSDLYTDLGLRVLAFSRPGYGRTGVGPLMAAEFVPAVAEVCDGLGISQAAATVGVSFGGLQAVHVAVALRHLAPRLVLHSCAPSTLPYPDTGLESAAGPLGFSPWTQGLTWRAIRTMTSSDRGVRLMMSTLSTLPVDSWWPTWTAADRASARATFAAMGSGSGFVTDLRQGAADRACYRQAVLRSVPCPTLVTASRHDRGVSFEAHRTRPGLRAHGTQDPLHRHERAMPLLLARPRPCRSIARYPRLHRRIANVHIRGG